MKATFKYILIVVVISVILIILSVFLLLQRHTACQLSSREVKVLETKANNGDIDAAWELYGCFEEDDKQSIHWLEVGAMAGDPRAKYNLYSILENRGDQNSVLYLLDAASHDYTLAQRELAKLYISGKYWQKDVTAAKYWLYRASDNEDNIAMYDLAKLLTSQFGSKMEACSLAQKSLRTVNKNSGAIEKGSALYLEITRFIEDNCK